jgi:DNA-binding CsgD family transcriptional regulator
MCCKTRARPRCGGHRQDHPTHAGKAGRNMTTTTVRAPLSRRENEVLTWVAEGKSAIEIAKILNIGKRTVEDHARNAIRKLGASNRPHAVAIALRFGLLDGCAKIPVGSENPLAGEDSLGSGNPLGSEDDVQAE